MSVSHIPSRTPRHAVIALSIASLFAATPVLAKSPVVKKTKPAAVAAAAGTAPTGVVLTDIVVQGLKRSDPTSVFNILPVKIGDTFNADKEQEVMKALYASGLYDRVNATVNGTVLQVSLNERSVISEVTITGMKNFDKKQVTKGLSEHGFGAGYPYDSALLDKVKEELKAMYADAGLVNATVSSEVKPQDRGQVAVSLTINEGKYLKVKKIVIDGNSAVSDRKIRSVMALNKNGLFSWYSKDSRFAPERLTADLESIRNYYLDKGYLDFDFVSVDTPSSEDGKGIQINLALKEGEQYRVNSIKLQGDTKDTPRAEIEKLVKYKTNAIYSRTEMGDIVRKIAKRLAQDGYALAKVEVLPNLDKSKHVVDVLIAVTPQERAYVRHVNINGNSRTKDDVIRREVRQMESALYSGEDIQLSRDRIDRLGYFSEVTVETVPVAGTNNQVDVNYQVKEVPTGDMKLGLGYSSSDKVSLTGSIHERNFMGTGNSLGLSIDTSKSSRNATVTTSNPYFTKSGVSSDFSAYYKTYDASKLKISDTKYTTIGLNTVFGLPLSERHRLFFGFNPEMNKIELGSSAPNTYTRYMTEYGTNNIKTYEASLGWSYDTRDSTYLPSRGTYQRALIAGSFFGTAKYARGTYQFQKFFPVSKNITLALNSQFDYGRGLSGQNYPFFRNLYAGGLGSIRGFDTSTVGPTSVNSLGEVSYLGGSKRAFVNLELQFPFPGMTKSRDVRLFTFADAGGLWTDKKTSSEPNSCNDSKISWSGCNGVRYSYGVGLTWNSPIGPLKFSYARPMNKKEHDKLQRFQFQIGTSF
ncbi:MAG: outer membrane protein assembly factor BamA [Formosimonas sp.]